MKMNLSINFILPILLSAFICTCIRTTPIYGFSSIEHVEIFNLNNVNDSNFISFTNDKGLKFGNINKMIALAFDYYGPSNANEIICLADNPKAMINEIINRFWTEEDDELYLLTVDFYLSYQNYKVKLANAHSAHSTPSVPSDGLKSIPIEVYALMPRVIELAIYNLDHFSSNECANKTFHTIYQLAVEFAANGNWTFAHLYFAWASHIATDLFSAGHLRVPRYEIFQECESDISAALTAMRMHDEDSINGVPIRYSDSILEWMSYGDNYLLDPKSSQNLATVREFLKNTYSNMNMYASASDISEISGISKQFQFEFPQTVEESHPNYTCPLWTMQNGKPYTRWPLEALYTKPCTFRPFVRLLDCSGFDTDALVFASLLSPTTIAWNNIAGGYISYPYEFQVSSTHKYSVWNYYVVTFIIIVSIFMIISFK